MNISSYAEINNLNVEDMFWVDSEYFQLLLHTNATKCFLALEKMNSLKILYFGQDVNEFYKTLETVLLPLKMNVPSLLVYAVRWGHVEIVKMLLENNVDRDLNNYIDHPIELAFDCGELEIAEILVDSKFPISEDELLYALTFERLDLFKKMYDQRTWGVGDRKDIMERVCSGGYLEAAQWLVGERGYEMDEDLLSRSDYNFQEVFAGR